MTTAPLEVLYEDNHLLVVNKPAGLPTMGTPGGAETLLTLAKDYVKRRFQKPGNVYLGVMSRLDAPVTGVVLLARTSKAAARLTEQFRAHTVEKLYWALVEDHLTPPAASISTGWSTMSVIAACGSPLRGSRGRSRPASTIGNCPRWATCRGSRWSWGPAGSTRFACSSPIMAIRSWATGNMAAGVVLPWGLPCTPGAWWWPIPCGTSGSVSRRRCRAPGPISGFAADLGGQADGSVAACGSGGGELT